MKVAKQNDLHVCVTHFLNTNTVLNWGIGNYIGM